MSLRQEVYNFLVMQAGKPGRVWLRSVHELSQWMCYFRSRHTTVKYPGALTWPILWDTK